MNQETKKTSEQTEETKQAAENTEAETKAEEKQVEEAQASEEKPAEKAEEKKPEEKKPTHEEELEAQVKKLTEQVNVLKNEYARAYADTENMKKRLQKEHDSFAKYHIQSFAIELLPVLDNCERALAIQGIDENMKKGLEMIYSQLKSALEKEGVTEIEAEGMPFDGNWHQALMSEHKDGVEPGMVLQVLQKGYKLKDRILRAAMVKVSD